MVQNVFRLGLVLLLMMPLALQAQDDDVTQTIPATDSLDLIADFYSPSQGEAVAGVVLLHMLGSNRGSWAPLIPKLLDANIAVLAVDMRGHGATGGERDWALAEQDVQILLDWLREQAGVESVSIIGGSIGGNLALRGMANDPDVVTAVALSPGRNYRDVTTEDAIQTIGDRPLMLVASRQDTPSGEDTQHLFDLTTGTVLFRLYEGRSHGTNLFNSEPALLDLITLWVVTQSAEADDS